MKTQADIDASNQYQSFLKGWVDAANVRALKPEFVTHENALIKNAYEAGYRAGRQDRNDALQAAAEGYGYEPTILRLQDET